MTLTLGDIVAVIVSQGYALLSALIFLVVLYLLGGFFIPDTPIALQFFSSYIIADIQVLAVTYYAETHEKKETTS